MTDQEKKGLLLLREDLEDMCLLHQAFGFGILRSSLPPPLVSLPFWQEVRTYFARRPLDQMRPMDIDRLVGRIDSISGRNEAIRWWGDRDGIEEYKAWAEKAYCFLKNHPALLAVRHSDDGWYELLRTLCSYAASSPKLSMFLEETVMNDDDLEQYGRNLVREDSQTTEKRLKITVVDVFPNALTFSLRFVGHLLGLVFHHLEIDKTNNIAVLDGIGYPLEKEQILILSLLLDAKGRKLSAPQMIEAEPDLEGKRIDRLVDKDHLPKPLFDLFDPERSQKYRLRLS